MKSKYQGYAGMVCYSRDLGGIPTTIKRGGTDTLTTKNILNKGSIYNTGIRTGSHLQVNTEEVIVSVLEEVVFRPDGKIMVNGLP
jgi:hypothetical protein